MNVRKFCFENIKFIKTGFCVVDDKPWGSIAKAWTTELVDRHIFLCRLKLILVVVIGMEIRTHSYEIR
jgi:hypothetical protein